MYGPISMASYCLLLISEPDRYILYLQTALMVKIHLRLRLVGSKPLAQGHTTHDCRSPVCLNKKFLI